VLSTVSYRIVMCIYCNSVSDVSCMTLYEVLCFVLCIVLCMVHCVLYRDL